VTILAATGNDAAVIGALLAGPLLGILVVIMSRLGSVQETVRNQGGNADGTT
jgi:hypothetical protein